MAGGSFFNAGIDRSGIYVVVENVRSLFNVGAIFRSADGVGASGVLLTGFTGQPPRKEISRVALGADEYVPWAYYPDALSAIGDLREQGVPVAFVVGHEVEGVRPETLEACDSIIHLPMLGQKVSLNVSVAAGIMLYRLLEAKTSRDSA